jgi:hypothetical protein
VFVAARGCGETEPKGATKAKATRYYTIGGIQAVRTDDGTVSFQIPDQQGTGQLSVDGSTLNLDQRRTTPFGDLRGTNSAWSGSHRGWYVAVAGGAGAGPEGEERL